MLWESTTTLWARNRLKTCRKLVWIYILDLEWSDWVFFIENRFKSRFLSLSIPHIILQCCFITFRTRLFSFIDTCINHLLDCSWHSNKWKPIDRHWKVKEFYLYKKNRTKTIVGMLNIKKKCLATFTAHITHIGTSYTVTEPYYNVTVLLTGSSGSSRNSLFIRFWIMRHDYIIINHFTVVKIE